METKKMFLVILLFAFIVIGGSYSVFAIVSGNGDNNTLSWDNITISGPSGNVTDDNPLDDMFGSDDSSDSSSNTDSSQPSQSSQSSQSSSSFNSYRSSSSSSGSSSSGSSSSASSSGSSSSSSSSSGSGSSSGGSSSDSGSSNIVDNGGHYYDVNTGDEVSF